MPLSLFSQVFDDPESWMVVASGQATGRLSRVNLRNGKVALRLDYDFHEGGGFVVARKEMNFQLPATFAVNFLMRADGPDNHFEFKVADPTNENAWRYQREHFPWPAKWRRVSLTEREIPFAWGPAGGGGPSEVGSLEFVVAAGPGGKGSLWLSDFSIEDQTLREPREVTASSERPGHEAKLALDDHAGDWRPSGDDRKPSWTMDFGKLHRFGGLVIHWPEDLPVRGYFLTISKTGRKWKRVHRCVICSETKTHVPIPKGEARFLRITFEEGSAAGLRHLELKPDSFSQSPNEFVHAVAADAPRGWYPRYWHREQSYWTPVGTPIGTRRALINEEGLVEVDEGSFSLEPFLRIDGGLVTWAEASIRLYLPRSGAPLPEVIWSVNDVVLTVRPWVVGNAEELTLKVNYQIENPRNRHVELAVAVRPFQVNPPWQAFRNLGGISPIRKINGKPGKLKVEGKTVIAHPLPSQQIAAGFEQGTVLGFLSRGIGSFTTFTALNDPSGLASAAMVWKPEVREVTLSVPFYEKDSNHESRKDAENIWSHALESVEWKVPPVAEEAIRCLRTAAAHILINRDGPALQPGPRRYTRSWVRDSVIMGAALMRLGIPEPLREFLDFYQKFQREDGFVPCVVDRDGVDWLIEHDSHGQFIWGVLEVFRQCGDRDFLGKMWPSVKRAAQYMLRIRSERLTDHFRTGEFAACYGLFPESASHEGYLAHPVHSYWDDFWGVRGFQAAVELADAMGKTRDRWQEETTMFLSDLEDSMKRVIQKHHLNYIPGSVEWADFDPTATSNAIALLDFADRLPEKQLTAMFDLYMADFRKKHAGKMPWKNYTAYEIRIISALIRLGRRDDGVELLEFFLSDRRPLEWNQWPEISWRDPRSPGHLGDVPHTWISAEYILAVLSMISSEREETDSLVLASGMPWSWISAEGGFRVNHLPTRFGTLDFSISARGEEEIEVRVNGSLTLPPGGVEVIPPLPPGMKIARVADPENHPLPVSLDGRRVALTSLPVHLHLTLCKTHETRV
ncbi:MAG: discoidin domain-containing protein [Luteolibacter sp.]